MATVYRLTANGLECRQGINSVDLQPYLNDGWSLSPPTIEATPNALQKEEEAPKGQVDLTPIEARLAELQALSGRGEWRALKAIAEGHGITRPGDGWDAAVIPILVVEYGQSAAEEIYTSPEGAQ